MRDDGDARTGRPTEALVLPDGFHIIMMAVRGYGRPERAPGPEPLVRGPARGCRSAGAALQTGAWLLVFAITL